MFKFVRIITLAAVVSAAAKNATKHSHFDVEEERAHAKIEKFWRPYLKDLTGNSTIGSNKFEVPQNADESQVPTYSSLETNTKDCTQCLFSGGTWSPVTYGGCKKKAGIQASQDYDAAKVDATLTYKQLFDGLNTCATFHGQKAKGEESFVLSDGTLSTTDRETRAQNCNVTYGAIEFVIGTGSGGSPPGSIKYSWKKQSHATKGSWCFIKTVLPKGYDGGLELTSKANLKVKFAARVNVGKTEYYFDNNRTKTLDKINGGSGIPLEAAQSIEVYMAQNNIIPHFSSVNDFELTFKRTTWNMISDYKPMADWAWVLIGMLICCCTLCLATCIQSYYKIYKIRTGVKEEYGSFGNFKSGGTYMSMNGRWVLQRFHQDSEDVYVRV